MSSVPESVDCPECGQSFDPKTQGGWCTNPDCGSYRWEPDDAESTPATDDSRPADEGADDAEPVDPAAADSESTEPETTGAATAESTTDDDSGEPETAGAATAESASPDADESEQDGGGTVGEEQIECPNCGEVVPDKNFCLNCGDSLEVADDDTDESSETPTCPDCGEEVEPDWAACINCGASLEESGSSEPESPDEPGTADDDDPPDTVVLEVGGSEIKIENGDVFGRRVRTAHVQAGGDEEDARYISREHALLEREHSEFYVVNKHQNGLQVNGANLPVDERKPVSDGDQLTFAGVTTATVRID